MKTNRYSSAVTSLLVAITYFLTYLVIALCWVGAEYCFEGVVIPSHIDSFANALLAFYITRDIVRRERKYRSRRCGDSNDI